MKHKSEDIPIKKGDYLELKHTATDMLIVRVTDITFNSHFVGLTKISMKVLTPLEIGHITWDFEYLQHLLNRRLQSPTDKRMIKLLYD